jgi:ppGpp synthetase/RelA/SpoT-type nucleotidyltranferase
MPEARTGTAADLPFNYDDFSSWYRISSAQIFDPAKATLVRLVNEWLDKELGDLDRVRIRVSSHRVKSAARLWAKLGTERYRAQVASLEDIPRVVDDVVGVRITCNNTSDLAKLRELIATLPSAEDDESASLSTDPSSEKRYYELPKESGYRAYHVNLITLIPRPGGWERVTGELQARTLLQDGWGELTHEDTYKPGVTLPPLATRLARRMADLLSAVDDIAQDLRDELDRLATQSVEEVGAEEDQPRPIAVPDAALLPGFLEQDETPDTKPEVGREALIEETQRVVLALTKEAPLARVAERVQANFGTNLAKSWGGFGSFSKLVQAAVPEATLVADRPPGYVFPPGITPSSDITDRSDSAVPAPPDTPDVVRRLQRHDRAVPLISSIDLIATIDGIAHRLHTTQLAGLGIDLRSPGIKQTNVLARQVRDDLQEDGRLLFRPQIDYLLKALLFSGNLRADLAPDEIATVTMSFIWSRAQMLGAVADAVSDREDLSNWFGLGGAQEG